MKFLSNIIGEGTLTLNSVANATVDTDKFLVLDSGVVKYRTGAQLLSDIGPITVPISSLTAATQTNTIGNGAFAQTWNWTGIANNASALTLTSTSSSLNGRTLNVSIDVNNGTPGGGLAAAVYGSAGGVNSGSSIVGLYGYANPDSNSFDGSYGVYAYGKTGTYATGAVAVFAQAIEVGPSLGGHKAFVGRGTLTAVGSTNYGLDIVISANSDTTALYGAYIEVQGTVATKYALRTVGGPVWLDTLSGTGTRMVVADANGVLSTQAIPSGASYTVTNEANNRLITSVSAGNGNAEENLLFDGATLTVRRPTSGTLAQLHFTRQSDAVTNSEVTIMYIDPPITNANTIRWEITSQLTANDDLSYTNHVIKQGFNILNNYPTLGRNFTSMESNWYTGGANLLEYHYVVGLPNLTESRVFSSTFIKRATLALSSNQWDFRATTYQFMNLTEASSVSISVPNDNSAMEMSLNGYQPVLKWSDTSNVVKPNGFIQYTSSKLISSRPIQVDDQDANGFNFIATNVGGASGSAGIGLIDDLGAGTAFVKVASAGGTYAGDFYIYSQGGMPFRVRPNGNILINGFSVSDNGEGFQVRASAWFSSTLKLDVITQDDALTQILVRDGSTGQIKYRAAGTLGGGGTNARVVESFTATASQTTFTITGGYTVGQIDVYYNGSRLNSSEFTASNGTTVVLGTGAPVGTIIDTVKYEAISAPSNLDSLTDVIITTATNGDVLQYNGVNWVNAPAPSGFTVSNSADNRILTSVTASTANAEANLTFNGTQLSLTGNFIANDSIARLRFFDNSNVPTLALERTGSSGPSDLWFWTDGEVRFRAYASGELQMYGNTGGWGTYTWYNNGTLKMTLNTDGKLYVALTGWADKGAYKIQTDTGIWADGTIRSEDVVRAGVGFSTSGGYVIANSVAMNYGSEGLRIQATTFNRGVVWTTGNIDGAVEAYVRYDSATSKMNLLAPLGVSVTNHLFLSTALAQDDALTQVLVRAADGQIKYRAASSFGGGVTDGDKGDITVSASGATWTIDNGAVTYAKIQLVTPGKILGNSTGSLVGIEEISINQFAFFGSDITGTPDSTTYLRGDGSWSTVSTGYSVTSQTTNYNETATSGTKIIKCDTTGGAFTVNLPTAVGNTAILHIKKVAGSADLNIEGNGTETIDGGLNAVIRRVGDSIMLASDNANWIII